jgi:hypothetical protein
MEDFLCKVNFPVSGEDRRTAAAKLFDVMHSLIDHIDDQFDCLLEVVDASSQAYIKHMQLLPKGLAAIGALAAR